MKIQRKIVRNFKNFILPKMFLRKNRIQFTQSCQIFLSELGKFSNRSSKLKKKTILFQKWKHQKFLWTLKMQFQQPCWNNFQFFWSFIGKTPKKRWDYSGLQFWQPWPDALAESWRIFFAEVRKEVECYNFSKKIIFPQVILSSRN